MRDRDLKGEKGFSLIETCIALVVMMVAGLAASSVFMYSMQNNIGGNDRALAMAVAQQQLEQLRSVAFNDATLAAGVTTTPDVRNADRGYTVVRTIVDETNANGTSKSLKRITIRVTPQNARNAWQRTAVELVSYRSTLAPGLFAAP
jgi:Tfp pilus assembly protein PilV